MYEPEFTVITATSNIIEKGQADDLGLLINLLDKQTYQFIEHIIIDNASTDGTLDLLKEYKNAGYINFFTEPDNGKFDAFNKGLLRAKGKYVGFLSCDDFYHDITAIDNIIGLMEQENGDFCFFPAYCRHPEGFAFEFVPAIYNVFQCVPCPRQAMIFKKSTLDKAECKHIYYQNYKSLYPVSDDILDRMVSTAEIPKPLLDKLAAKFPPEDSELFYERYKQMYDLRVENIRNQRMQQRHKN